MCRTQPSSQGPPTVAGLQATPTWAAGRTFITHDLTTSLPSTAPCCPEEEPPTPWPSEQGLRSAHLACPSSLTAWVRAEKQTSVCGTLLLTSRHPQIPVHAQSLSPCLAGMHDPSAYVSSSRFSHHLFQGAFLDCPCASAIPCTSLHNVYHTVQPLLTHRLLPVISHRAP